MKNLLLVVLAFAIGVANGQSEFVVPPSAFYHNGQGGGVLDVTKPPFNAKGDGIADDTAALTAALRFVRDHHEIATSTNGNVSCSQRKNRAWIVYLPNGTYRVTDTVSQGWPALALNNQYGWNHIRYELVQTPAEEAYLATRFEGVNGKPYLHGDPTIAALDTANGSFLKGQYMETSIYGEANWAIRVRGESRDGVRIRLDDGAKGFGAGANKAVLAFYLLQRGSNVNSGNFLENVTIDTGKNNSGAVALAWSASNFGAVRNVRLVGEGAVGIDMPVNNACSHFRDLEIDGFRTAVALHAGRESVVTLERATIRRAELGFLVGGADAGGGADVLNLWQIAFDRVRRPYELRRAGVLNALECPFDAGTRRPCLAPSVPPRATYAAADMTTPEAFGAVGDGVHDDTEAVRRALKSGHARLVFTHPNYRIDGTVSVPATVKEIDGLHAHVVRAKASDAAIFRLDGESSDPLLFHRFFFAGGVVIDHISSRVPVIEDVYVEFHHVRDGACADGEMLPKGADPASGLWYVYRNATPVIKKRVFAANCIQFCGGGASDGADVLENVELQARMLNNEHFPGPIFSLRNSSAWIYGLKSEDAPALFALRSSDVDIYGASFLLFAPQPGPIVESIDSRYSLDLYLWHWQMCPPVIFRETVDGVTTEKLKNAFRELPGENAAYLVRHRTENSREFSIVDCGAKSDGSTCSRAFAKAMDAMAAAGGGRIVVPKGRWFTGPIRFQSNCELHLAEGAEVVFTQKLTDYLPAVPVSWEGVECWNYSPLLYAYGCTNVAITGKGTLRAFDGEFKDSFWSSWMPRGLDTRRLREHLYEWCSKGTPLAERQLWRIEGAHARPHFIHFNRCRNVRLGDFTLRNSPFWTIHLYLCDGVKVSGLDVSAHGRNTDGIDLEMTRNAVVENCKFDQGDDGIVVKAGRNAEGWRLATPSENIVVTNCQIACAFGAFTIGSEISGGAKNIVFRDSRVSKCSTLCHIKTNRRRGGVVEGIRYENLTAEKVSHLFLVWTDAVFEWSKFPDYELRTTRIGDVTLKHIHAAEVTSYIDICGDAGLPVDGVRLSDVRADIVRTQDRLVNVNNVTVDGHPVATSRTYSIADFGATPQDATEGVRRAIAAASAAGCGRVLVPSGEWESGPIDLKSGVELCVPSSSKLLMKDDPALYRQADGSYRPLIRAAGVRAARLSSGFWGIVEAKTEGWQAVDPAKRPPLMGIVNCTNVVVDTIALHNTPSVVIKAESSRGLAVCGVEFIAPVREDEFVVLRNCGDAFLSGSSFRIGDGRLPVEHPSHKQITISPEVRGQTE